MYNVFTSLKFTWNNRKNEQNIKKHGVSFEEAKSVFAHNPLEIFFDSDHSQSEDRYVAVGVSQKGRVLVVVHSENSLGTEIRIISARKATKKEQQKILERRGL